MEFSGVNYIAINIAVIASMMIGAGHYLLVLLAQGRLSGGWVCDFW